MHALSSTLGTLYQQGWPRRVMEASMMSSATRKKACSHSMHQPSTHARRSWLSVTTPRLSCRSPSTTASPRLSLPPGTLYSTISRTHDTACAGWPAALSPASISSTNCLKTFMKLAFTSGLLTTGSAAAVERVYSVHAAAAAAAAAAAPAASAAGDADANDAICCAPLRWQRGGRA